MAKTIKKLTKLNNPECFIQVNTVKGFKYIDKAGEIVNFYHVDDIIPRFSMGLNGLIIDKPKDKIDTLKVTSQMVWMKFSQIDSLDMVSDLFSKETKEVLSILEVKKLNRIGWRNYFIYEFSDQKKQEEYFAGLANTKAGKLSFIKLEIQHSENLNVNLRIQAVVKNDEQQTPGVLFDVDVFQAGNIEPENISKILRNIRQYLADEDGFLSVINNTFID